MPTSLKKAQGQHREVQHVQERSGPGPPVTARTREECSEAVTSPCPWDCLFAGWMRLTWLGFRQGTHGQATVLQNPSTGQRLTSRDGATGLATWQAHARMLQVRGRTVAATVEGSPTSAALTRSSNRRQCTWRLSAPSLLTPVCPTQAQLGCSTSNRRHCDSRKRHSSNLDIAPLGEP